ncbi:MAG: hypothetical protein [Circular genetic element sp.]|nr:MAG: hypothetical protein [Circular genetic element sp.]
MPTKREREYYRMGFLDGRNEEVGASNVRASRRYEAEQSKPKRKLSAWNKYVKANSNKPRFRYRNGKLNLKKLCVAFRKTPAGKKKK